MTTLKTRRSLLLIVLGVCLVSAACPVIFSDAATTPWTYQFEWMNVHFDWTGSWDKTSLWAYGLAYLNIYNWSYAYGWYGLGWDKLSPLNKAPSNKLECYFYNDANDKADGWSSGLTIKFNLARMEDLDIKSTKWATQVCNFGSILSHECSHSIFGAYVGSTRPDGDYSNWLTEALAYYTGDCLWPWAKGDWDHGNWAPLYSKAEVESNYKNSVNTYGAGGRLTWYESGKAYTEYFKGITSYARFNNAWWTFHAAGYYLSNMTDTSGNKQGVYNNAYFLSGLKAGKNVSNAFYGVWGVTLNQSTTVNNNKGDFYYFFYQYWWA